MIFDVRALSAQKHLETRHAQLDWLRAFESARQSLKFIEIDYQTLELMAFASASPEKFTTLSRLIYQYGKSHPHGALISDLILNSVNESPFSLADWIDAVSIFNHWLEENRRKIDFLPMLEYLRCCVASPDAREAGQTLAVLVEDMLEVSGYEG